MNPTTTESYETFKALRDKAIADLLELRKQVKKSFEEGVAALRVAFESESSEVDMKLAELGHKITQEKKTSDGESKRRRFAKVSDAELKSRLASLLEGDKKLPSSAILSVCEIARPRLTQFLKANPDFIITTGNKRSTLYSLK